MNYTHWQSWRVEEVGWAFVLAEKKRHGRGDKLLIIELIAAGLSSDILFFILNFDFLLFYNWHFFIELLTFDTLL